MKLVSTNYVGMSIILISVALFIIMLDISLDYARVGHSLCGSPYCNVASHIPVQSYVGFGLLLLAATTGGYLTFQKQMSEKSKAHSKANLNKIISSLQPDEKKVFDEVMGNEGSIFQNDLISKTGYSKVKISRILDRLETKGMVERRRRGMANLILAKY